MESSLKAPTLASGEVTPIGIMPHVGLGSTPHGAEIGNMAGEVNDDEAMLQSGANLAAIELHSFLHRASKLDRPTCVAFDPDPGDGADLLTCIEVDFLITEILDEFDLRILAKVSGSRGSSFSGR